MRHKLSSKQYRYGVVISNELGCCWIATYNVAQMLGMELNPEDIIREYENMGMFLQGFFGVHPFAIAKFFADRGYNINVHIENLEKFDISDNSDDLPDLPEANIMYYDKPQMGHYVAIKYDGEKFNGYNTFSSNSKGCDYSGKIISVLEEVTAEGMEVTYTGKVLISVSLNEQMADSLQ